MMRYYHVTICIKYSRRAYKDYEVCPLSQEEIQYLKGVTRTYFTAQKHRLVAFKILCDHIHLLIQSNDLKDLKLIIARYKGFTGYKLNINYRNSTVNKGRQSILWSRKYNITFIKDLQHLQNTLKYIKNNKDIYIQRRTEP